MTASVCSSCVPTSKPAGDGLNIVDFAFQPDVLTVTGGRQVTIRVDNMGSVRHNLSIPVLEVGVDYEPGQSSNLIFIAPESGPVELFCRYHRDEGMTGTLMVQG